MTLRVRASRAGEEEALAEAGRASFRLMDRDAWLRYFREHPSRSPGDTLVAEEDGELAGHATALRLTMGWRGLDLPFRGIAAVAVAPEARRRGVAEKLMRERDARMRAAGEPIALLYPFSAGFYGRLGYGLVEHIEILRVQPRQLPGSPLRANVRRLDLERHGAAMRGLYEQLRQRSSGLIARSDWWWRERVLARAPDRVGFFDGDRLLGYLLYDVPASPGSLGQQHVLAKELLCATPDAWRGLYGFLQALGEQFALVELSVPRGTAAALIKDPGAAAEAGLFKLSSLGATGAMARIADVAGALAVHPGRARGTFGLDVIDPIRSRPQSHDVTASAAATRTVAGNRARHRLALGSAELAQIYFAAVSARRLLELGLISGSPAAADLLDTLTAGPALWMSRLNLF